MSCRHLALLAFLGVPTAVVAQGAPDPAARHEVFVGSELERYVRFLQIEGRVPLYPWSIGAFSPVEVDRLAPVDSQHPWARRYRLSPDGGAARVTLLAPTITTIENTAFPYGSNDGPIWAGRGVTAAVQVGVAARYRFLSVTAAPLVFSAQNAAFQLQSNGRAGNLVYADGLTPLSIDRPQRFGNRAYNMIDPGQSTIRVDLPGVAIGVSTANQRWGPGEQYPIILGNNAAGFPHVFIGTSAPLNVWLARVHGRVVWGELFQSDYSPATGVGSKRFMSGAVVVITPRGLSGLELGVGRFFHTPWPAAGLRVVRDFRKPVEWILKVGVPSEVSGGVNEDLDNQLASAFFRWVFPASGLEIYGEYGREDHSWDVRDFLLEPDHSSGYMLGLRKVWRRDTDRFIALRAEMVDLQPGSLARGRGEVPFYIHGYAVQGHTYRGQVLGADVGSGGAGSTLAVDSYHPGGRWTVAWSRVLREDLGEYWLSGIESPRSMDVAHSLSAEGVVFHGPFDLTARVSGVYEFNRDFQHDAFNLNLLLRVRAALR